MYYKVRVTITRLKTIASYETLRKLKSNRVMTSQIQKNGISKKKVDFVSLDAPTVGTRMRAENLQL